MTKKEKIFNELDNKGFIDFTIKDYSDNKFVDISIKKNGKIYNVYYSNSGCTYVHSYEKLNNVLDYIIKTSEIYL